MRSNWETPLFGGQLKAPHALDVPFTFDTIDFTNATDRSAGGTRAGDDDVGHLGGIRPQPAARHPAMPSWPAYNQTERATMMLDTECRIDNDPGGETRLLWKAITGT